MPQTAGALVALFLLTLSASAQAPPDTLDVFVVAGQSNATGAGGEAAEATPVVPGTAYWAWIRNRTTRPATLLFEVGTGHRFDGSLVPAFAREYTAETGRKAAFVRTGVGRTTTTAAADNGRGHWSAQTAGPGASGGPNRLEEARETVDLLFADVPEGIVLRAAGVIWVQGESDADQIDRGVITRRDYRRELAQTAPALRALLTPYRAADDPPAPMFVARVAYLRPADSDGYASVRREQDRAARLGLFTMTCRHMYRYLDDPDFRADRVHWSQRALNHVGRHLAGVAARDVVPSAHTVGRAPTAARAALAAARRPYPNPVASGRTVRGLAPSAPVLDVLGRRVAWTAADGSLAAALRPGVYAVGGARLTVR